MNTSGGGAAFPMGYHRDGNSADHQGMSLRDWFAGQVLSGVVRAEHRLAFNPADDAAWAYSVADAMLAAREREDGR